MKNKRWKGAAGECIGPLHERQGITMQDAHTLRFFTNGFVAAVSDGVGSRPHSDIGSKVACKVFAKCFRQWKKHRRHNFEELLCKFHKAWLKEIFPNSASDCAATFLCCVCIGSELFLAQIGDGMIAVTEKSGGGFVLCDSKSESFSNITDCLGEKIDLQEWRILKMSTENLECVFLCTDGISDDLQKGEELNFVRDLFSQYRSIGEKMIKKDMDSWLKAWPVPRHSDDKTVVFVSHIPKFVSKN